MESLRREQAARCPAEVKSPMLLNPADILMSGNGGFVCFMVLVGFFVVAAIVRKTRRACPRCRMVNRSQARYCAQCGTKLNRP